jgi:hypothetical protein
VRSTNGRSIADFVMLCGAIAEFTQEAAAASLIVTQRP